MEGCIFCRIVEGKIPAKKLGESDKAVAFADLNPVAPVHALVIPKQHLASINEAGDGSVMAPVFELAARVAKEQGVAETGWRAVINTGAHANQTVFHVHLHVIGGRPMSWPPG